MPTFAATHTDRQTDGLASMHTSCALGLSLRPVFLAAAMYASTRRGRVELGAGAIDEGAGMLQGSMCV